ncbi:hypothetical protein LK07_20495 [Streptomyces pluripotens]|uniref:Uncharacterized protein n=1 Tax=Streptomyces pluripotens TaxID=1355015 RepID=A0A221P1F6_9ACTN|nr:hypothetical protein LK07_20495 [Streptomyces pluripotens]
MHLVVDDPEASEHGLVELAADSRRSAEVQPVCVGAQQQRLFYDRQDGFDLDGTAVDDLLHSGQFARDALLLGLQEVERDGVGVAHLDQLELCVL